MKLRLRAAAAALIAISLIGSSAGASEGAAAKKPTATKAKKAKREKQPSIPEQIQALRHQLENQAGQIENLKQGLAEKDAKLKTAELTAAEAQATAAKTQAVVASEQLTSAENAAAVASLSSAVTGLKTQESALSKTVSTEAAKVKKAMDSPAVLRYKGITLRPSGFFNGESVYRTHATGGELPTAFSSIPYEHADSYSLSETYITGRQSRIALLAEGKMGWGVMRAYLEGDFLGTGTTSNDNQSASYVYRQRVAMAEIETNSHWTFSGGQGWTLAAENTKGISTAVSNMNLPLQIDPNYVAGFVWNRGGGFRVTRSFRKAAVAVSVENPQLLYTASLAGSTPYAVLGSAGNNGGAFNATISGCTPSTSIVNYTNQALGTTNVGVPVYKTVNSCANLANISFNQAPDGLAKVAFDPGWGHYEVFGIARFGHETIYPGETTNSTLYGGLKDIATGATVAPALSAATSISDSIVLGGAGASVRVPVIPQRLSVGAKGLYGAGVGRYGDSTLSDVTANAWGGLSPIHNFSGLGTVEITPVERLVIYAYYGGDYAAREDNSNSTTTTLGTPAPCFVTPGLTGCQNTKGALTLPATLSAAQIAAGTWGATWATSQAAVGYGSRLLSNASCTSTTAPGYNGSSTGFYSGASCGAQTRDVQEGTIGYWYDIYKGDRGRFRQGLQYGYAVREGWSGGLGSDGKGIGAKGLENMVFTSFRYYLP